MKKRFLLIAFFTVSLSAAKAQNLLKLSDILQRIERENPELKMSDAEIRSMDEAAKGARNWESPKLGTGLLMSPYNTSLWRKMADGTSGMGQYMISAEQMFPKKSMQDANVEYMNAASSVEKENKNARLNELKALAKKNYFEWQIIQKKDAVLVENEKLLRFMIKDTEIRYKNGLDKLSAYYKATAALGKIENMRLMLKSEIIQKRILLNTLMNQDKQEEFSVDTVQTMSVISSTVSDSSLIRSRSDIKAIDQNINLIALQQNIEKSKLKPGFGLRYDHMFGFGGSVNQFTLMGMMIIPMPWSTRTEKANIESLKWRAESLNQQKQMLINESMGMASTAQNELELKKNQVKLFETNIIPALRRNYQSMQIGYQQNTEELFMLYDAWESLNMAQLEYLEQVKQVLLMQAELERILEIK